MTDDLRQDGPAAFSWDCDDGEYRHTVEILVTAEGIKNVIGFSGAATVTWVQLAEAAKTVGVQIVLPPT